MIQFYEKDLEEMIMEALSGKTKTTLADRGFHFLDECLQYPHRVERQCRIFSTGGGCVVDIAVFVDAPDAKRAMLIELKKDAVDYAALFQSRFQQQALENGYHSYIGGARHAYEVYSCVVGASIQNFPANTSAPRAFDLAVALSGVDVYTYGFGFDTGLAFRKHEPNLRIISTPLSSMKAQEIERLFPSRRPIPDEDEPVIASDLLAGLIAGEVQP